MSGEIVTKLGSATGDGADFVPRDELLLEEQSISLERGCPKEKRSGSG